jgi:oligosaccharyltransferase complex subunit alpha (ribophorin I)
MPLTNCPYRNVKFYTSIPESSITETTVDHQRTYLDTVGRTVLTIKGRNLPDELRDRELYVSYDYSLIAGLRKPFVIFTSMMGVFVGAWLLSKVEVKFSTK